MRFNSIAFSLHRFLGMLISLLFLMWFVTGLVFIYYPFPSVSQQARYEHQEKLPQSLPNIDSILAQKDSIISIEKIFQFQGQTLFKIKSETIDTLTLNQEILLKPDIQKIAKEWVDAEILKIDTLTEREQWIMYTSYIKKMPIYKFYFDDKKKHQLYIESKTGSVLQFTSRKQRIGAWFGAIPHKLYFPFIRKHTRIWINTLTVLGAIAFISILFGMYLGIKLFFRKTNKRKYGSPYKKKWHLWHHISGLIFGIFLLTWSFSGAMSLQRIPKWIVKTHTNYKKAQNKIIYKNLPTESYKLDYRTVINTIPNTKEIKWSSFYTIPIYEVVAGDSLIYIDASTDKVKSLDISKQVIESAMNEIHGDSIPYNIELMAEYDNYYISLSNSLQLPIYKVVIDDMDNSTYYIDSQNGYYKYINKDRRARKWIFSALHYFNIPFFAKHKVLWTIVIWALCLGGIVVSGSGVYLSWKYLARKFRKTRRKFNLSKPE